MIAVREMIKNYRIFYWGLIVLTVISGTGVIYSRYDLERENKTQELIMSYNALKNLSKSHGYPLSEILSKINKAGFVSSSDFLHLTSGSDRKARNIVNALKEQGFVDGAGRVTEAFFKKNGRNEIAPVEGVSAQDIAEALDNARIAVRSIAMEERTLEKLQQDSSISFMGGYEIINTKRISKNYSDLMSYLTLSIRVNPDYSYIVVDEASLYEDIRNALIMELGQDKVNELRWNILEIKSSKEYIKDIPLGFDRNLAKILTNYEFKVIPRLTNSYSLNAEQVGMKINGIVNLGVPVSTIMFEGDSVLGYKSNISTTIQKLGKFNLIFGMVEFAKQKGDEIIAKQIPLQTMKVHSIPEKEMGNYRPATAAKRFLRAAHERNIKYLFVNPFSVPDTGVSIIDTNLNYLTSLTQQLKKGGFKIGDVSPYAFNLLQSVPLAIRVMVLLSLWAAVMLLIDIVIRFSWYAHYVASGVVLVLGTVLLIAFSPDFINPLLALLAAVVFPALAVISVYPHDKYFKPLVWVDVAKKTAKMYAISLMGAVFVVLLLSMPAYMLGLRTFIGVKVSFLAPLFISGVFFFVGAHRFKSIFYVMKRTIVKPITNGYLAILLLLSVMVVFYITRSGNNFVIPMTRFEGVFRDMLESMLYARPRTKEILLAYPIVVFSLYTVNRYIKYSKAWLFASLATIAPISLINTFAHIHSPLMVSFVRSFTGLIMGSVIGALITFAFVLGRKVLLMLEKR